MYIYKIKTLKKIPNICLFISILTKNTAIRSNLPPNNMPPTELFRLEQR